MSNVEKFDVLVLGGGSGLTAAYYAGQDGKSVAVVACTFRVFKTRKMESRQVQLSKTNVSRKNTRWGGEMWCWFL